MEQEREAVTMLEIRIIDPCTLAPIEVARDYDTDTPDAWAAMFEVLPAYLDEDELPPR